MISTSNRSPCSPRVHGGSSSTSHISQFTAAVTTGRPSTIASQRNRRAATVPASIGTTSSSLPCTATATSWVDLIRGSVSKPSSSVIIRTDALNPASSNLAIGPPMARSGVRPKPITSRTTSGALYVRRSENSSARTWVIADDSDDTISGKRSVMPPGWMPDPCSVAPPARQASSMACTAGLCRSG